MGGIQGVLGNAGILNSQCGPQNNDPQLREDLGCPPLEGPALAGDQPVPGASPPPPGPPPPGGAPGHISEYEVPGATQILQGMEGAQLDPSQQLQANLGQGRQNYEASMTGPPLPAGPGQQAVPVAGGAAEQERLGGYRGPQSLDISGLLAKLFGR